MEQDINNLNEIINLCNEELDNKDENVTSVLDLTDLLSLRNLIKAYKELEEENKELKGKISEAFLNGYNNRAQEEIEMKINRVMIDKKREERIKELEEKNKKKSIEIICYQEELENSIPVSLVEEKIEELNEYYKKEIYPSLMNWSDIDITEYYDGMIGILQELLEKRK